MFGTLVLPDMTGWNYQESTGLLLSKTYADNNSVSYEYDIKGNLTKRTWARAVLTNYAYNSLDEMTGITYSDATPAISFTYNRIGQQKTITDVVGTRTFSYNEKLQLTGETINGIYNKLLTRSYDTLGRSSGFAIEGDNYAVAYGYDNLGRMNSLTSGTDVFSYSYLPNSDLISTITMPNGISTTKNYEANRNLITSVENKFNTTIVSKYDYVNDTVGRRTSMAKSGTAFNVADTIDYGYNSKSEVISAVAQNDTTYNYAYNFDNIGNRITATEAGNIFSYTSNPLNQYLTVTGRTNPTYDVDGNMLTDGTGWTYTWDAENRLKTASKNSLLLECKYDYMSRRVEKKLTNSGTVTTQKRYVYDTWNLASEYDVLNALNSRSYVWGLDLTQTLQGAGGVGGLLSSKDSSGTYYSLYDANGNITQYLDASGNKVAHYDYNPFGRVSSKAGTKADDMPFQFSTKYLDNETELSYYGYRYYSPELGRWINRDPIGERGGDNLYVMVGNTLIVYTDLLGLKTCIGTARALKGNKKLIGKPGGFSTDKKDIPVQPGSAAVDPAQWGNDFDQGKRYLRDNGNNIRGIFTNENGEELGGFDGITDVIGGKVPKNSKEENVRDYFDKKHPNTLTIEMPSAEEDLGIVTVTIFVPDNCPCPKGTQ